MTLDMNRHKNENVWQLKFILEIKIFPLLTNYPSLIWSDQNYSTLISTSARCSTQPSSRDMASTEGLSRRRVATSATSYNNNDEDLHTSSNLNGGSNLGSRGDSPPMQHAGSAFERGNKIAFDPRDLQEGASEEARIGGKMPRLTIMEEVLLLGLKDKQVSQSNRCLRKIPDALALQGYLSFWNDNISYALRGCILIELALRRRIAVVRDPNRRRVPISERLIEVIDDKQTGETILDEALKMMKGQQAIERLSINSWIDLMSGMVPFLLILPFFDLWLCKGETWNVMKIGFQLKQVRERLAKGLVDKGVLRTEKRNFLLFDMATHPVADVRTKESIIGRLVSLLTSTTSAIPPAALDKEAVQCRHLRAVCLACAAYTASVLDNAFGRLGYEEREAAFQRCDEILAEFITFPFGTANGTSVPATAAGRRRQATRIATGGAGVEANSREAVMGLVSEVKKEAVGGDDDTGFEVVAGVMEVLSKLDSLL